MALAALPLTPASSISKSAAFSLTQSLRALLAGRRRTSSPIPCQTPGRQLAQRRGQVLERQNAALAHVQPVTAEAKKGAKADPPQQGDVPLRNALGQGDETR